MPSPLHNQDLPGGNFGGFEHSAAADINELRQKLKGYGTKEAFLKEILQNTDDAGATLQRIAWISGREDAIHPLLKGPAIVLINDKPLSNAEVRAIKRMGLGTKGAKQHAIGKFGQGIKSIFQICEAFFFLARDPTAQNGGDRPNVIELCNPWHGWHHSEWDRFEAEDTKEILGRVAGLLPDGPWFLLFLPLRRKEHLSSGGLRVQPIIESHEGDAPLCPASFRERLVDDIPALLPLLKNVVSVELYERWEGKASKPDLKLSIAPGFVRCVFDPAAPSNSDLQGKVLVRGARNEDIAFVGATHWVKGRKLEVLAEHDLRPQTVGVLENGEPDEQREKAHAHAGVSITCKPSPEKDARGRIEFRWAVFLPISGEPLDRIEWPVPLELSFHFHGYFFLDATRTRLDGQDGDPPFPEVALTDERSFCKQWNHVLAREGTLPLLPKALERLCQLQLAGDAAKATQLTEALRHTSVFRTFPKDITRTHHWALCFRSGKAAWKALPKSKRIIGIPPADNGGIPVITTAFPGLEMQDELGGAAVVIYDVRGTQTSCTSLLGSTPAAWDAAALNDALHGVTPGHFENAPDARNYLLRFLQTVEEPVRLELLDGTLSDVRLFPFENSKTGVLHVLSPSEVRKKMEAGRLISNASDPHLAKALAGVVSGDWWRLIEHLSAEVEPSLRNLISIDLRAAAKLVMECEHLGPLEPRQSLMRYFLNSAPWFNEHAPERMAARYLLHSTFDRKEHTEELFLQSPNSPPEWLEIVRYLLDESAEDWRMITDWIDLRLEQRNQLGLSVLDWEGGKRLLGELGPDTDFENLLPARRKFILKECDDIELLRSLPIHELTTVKLTSAGDNTYLDSEIQLENSADQSLWRELSTHSHIVVRLVNERLLEARQKEVFEERTVDAHGIMRMAISNDEPLHFWPLLLACLKRVGTPRAEIRELLINPAKRWLPLQLGRAIAAADVLSIPCADEAVHRLLGEERDGAVSVLALDERVRSHAGFSSLKSQILPSVQAALETLGSALQGRNDCRTGVSSIASAAELKELCAALDAIDAADFQILPLLRALASDSDVAERALALCSVLSGPLAVQTTHAVLGHLAERHQTAGNPVRKTLLTVFRRLLGCAVANQQWQELCNLETLFPSRTGSWKRAADLVHNFEAAPDEFLVEAEIGEVVRSAIPESSAEIVKDTVGKPEHPMSIEDYAAKLTKVVPSEFVGLFVAILGGTNPNVDLASSYLRGMDVRQIISNVIPSAFEVFGRNVLDAWSRIRFFPEIHSEGSIEAISIAGTPVEIPVKRNNATLLFGEFALKATAPLARDGTHINHRLQLLDLSFFDSQSEDDWIERIVGTMRTVLSSRYCLEDFSGLNRLVERLRSSHGQWDVRVAQRMILKSGDQLIQTLGVQRNATLRALFGKWQKAKQLEAQFEEGLGGEALRGQAGELSRSAEEELRNLITDSGEVRQTFLEGMRRRITDFQYFADSVLFELFQNADDACLEQCALDNVDPSKCSGDFCVQSNEEMVSVVHHGRPINRPMAGAGSDPLIQDYSRDLQKMLLLNASDKDMTQAGLTGRTGHFGLGFKSVHLITDEPVVVSGDLAFRVFGGVFPERLEKGVLRSGPQSLTPNEEVPATSICLPLRAGVSQEQVAQRFERLSSTLVIFAKCIRRISIEGQNCVHSNWKPARLSFHPSAEIGEVAALDGEKNSRTVVIVIQSHDDHSTPVSLLISLSGNGFKTLPDDLPALWATAPLDVEGGEIIALNAPFDVDAGRRQLGIKSDRNVRIVSTASEVLGSFLVSLAKHTKERWKETALELRLSPNTTREAFWLSLWKSMPTMREDSGFRRVVYDVLFSGPSSGFLTVLLNEEILPTFLGEKKCLTRWSEVAEVVSGVLDKAEDIFDGLWPDAGDRERSVISDSRVLRKIRIWFPELRVEHIRKVTLRIVLSPQDGEDFQNTKFGSPEARRFGKTLTRVRIQQLQQEEPDLWQNEWKPLAALLSESKFKGQDGHFRKASLLLSPMAGAEEEMRCSFAPEEGLLGSDYCENATNFFLLCRGELQLGSDTMIQWARDSVGKRLSAVFRYLMDGDRWIREQMVAGLGREWIARSETTPEFGDLPQRDKETLWALFRHRIQFDDAPLVEPGDDATIHTTPERLLEWWKQRRTEAPSVTLTDEWGKLLFKGALRAFDVESVADALMGRNVKSLRKSNHVWFRTLCLCCLLGTRTRREYVRGFLEKLIDGGFMDRVIPSGSFDSDELFESEVRRVMDEIMDTPHGGENATGEHVEFWRRIFYDARKMYRAVYLNDLPGTLLDVFETSQDPRAPARFLRSGFLAEQANFSGLIGQSFNSPIFFLMRELRRLGVITHTRFDQTCFYVCSPVRHAAKRLGILGPESNLNEQDFSFEAHLELSEALFQWVSKSSVAEEYRTDCFEMPFFALHELNAYHEL